MTDYAALILAVAGRPAPDGLADALADALPRYGITTPLRIAHFIAQTCEETGRYVYMQELGGRYYFARYDGRADLGNTEPGDGFRFRGRGLLQLTGRAAYTKYGQLLGLDLIGAPGLAASTPGNVETAAAFWRENGLNALADADDLEEVTRRINGGLTGLDVRSACLTVAKAALGVQAPQPAPAPGVTAYTGPLYAAPAQNPYGAATPVVASTTGAPTPAPEGADSFQIPTFARELWTAYGHRALAWLSGVFAAGSFAVPREFVIAFLITAVLLAIVVIVWARIRESDRDALLRRALAATPTPPTPTQGATPNVHSQ